jgi:hypothetical protein
MILVDGLLVHRVAVSVAVSKSITWIRVAHRPARDWSVVSEEYMLREWSRRKLAVVADDRVEPHRRVPILRRNLEDAAGQGRSNTYRLRSATPEACVGDMTASSWLIRMKLGGSHDCTIVDSDEYPTAELAHPQRLCRVFAGVGRRAAGGAGGNYLLHDAQVAAQFESTTSPGLHFSVLTVVPCHCAPSIGSAINLSLRS